MDDRIRTLTAEQLVDNARPMLPTVSPDGRRVAYLVSEMGADRRRYTELWVASADAQAEPIRLTTGLRGVKSLRWTADSGSLLYIASGQIHRTSPDVGRGQTETLTTWRSGISDQSPLSNGRTVAFVAPDEPSEEDERRRDEGDDAMVWGRHEPFHRLRLLDLDGRRLSTVHGLDERHVVALRQRPDGRALAVISWADPLDDPGAYTARLHVVDPETGMTRDLGALGLDACSPVWWRHENAWHISYIAVPPGMTAGLGIFDVTVSDGDAAEEHCDLTAGLDACPIELVQVAQGPPLALVAEGLDTAVYRLEPGTMRFHRILRVDGGLDMLAASDSGSVIAVRKSTAHEPKDVFAGPPHGPLARLSETQPGLVRAAWGGRERLVYRAADGLEIEALLVLPPGRTRDDGPFPLVTWIHGGPYARHADELALADVPAPQWLAAAGYAVFLPNPRGSQGRGRQFAALAQGAVGEDEWTDVLSGIDLLVDEGVADADRLAIGGWSHGGFMAAWAVGQTRRFKAALMGAGISDWGMQVGLGELGTQEGALTGSHGWEGPGPHRHDRLSPISYASRVRTPVLILHGELDANVPLGQAIYFHRALSHYGVEHEFVVYPREPHGVWERAHRLDVMRRSVAWFDRWLGAAS
jgi:dipeptidyl aminopeptidase/acylaminoacyl peptidase